MMHPDLVCPTCAHGWHGLPCEVTVWRKNVSSRHTDCPCPTSMTKEPPCPSR